MTTMGQFEMTKELGPPWTLFKDKSFIDLMRPTKNILLGHNRYATIGAINKVNAHPFDFPNVVGCHNGTLRNQNLLDNSRMYEVDSENIYDNINDKGLKHTVDRLHGAYALTWINKEKGTLNVLRNADRELFWCKTLDDKTVYWASEAWMLSVALGRNGLKHTEPVMFEEMTHYEFDVERGFASMVGKLPKPRCQTYVEYLPPQKSFGSYYGGYSQGQKSLPKNKKMEKKKEMSHLRQVIGTTVEFCVIKAVESKNTLPYILGYRNGHGYSAVRMYCHNRPETWDMLVNTERGTVFSATARSYTEEQGSYILLDPRTAVVLDNLRDLIEDEEDDESHMLYEVSDRTLVTESEWRERTNSGCAFCSSPAQIDDADDYVWLSRDVYVCEGCKDFDEVQPYLPS